MQRGKVQWGCVDCLISQPFDEADARAKSSLPVLDTLPSVLALPLHEYATEPSPVLRLHRLCDAVEILTRFCAIVAIGEVRGLNAGNLPEDVLAELQPRIEMPTFGKGRGMLDALLAHLPRTAPLVIGELPELVRGQQFPASAE
jgi:hypothetical protein